MKKQISSFDLVKIIGSLMIFLMHINAFADYGKLALVFELLSRWVVPFFFISSAYFLFSKSKDGNIDRKTLEIYVKRMSLLYLLWAIYNLPNIYATRFYGEDLNSVDSWIRRILTFLLSSTFTGSWYLLSSIFSGWFIYSLSKKMDSKKVILLTSGFLIISVLTSVYKELLPKTFSTILCSYGKFPFNIFTGTFYFAVGKYIYEKETELKEKYKDSTLWLVMVAFYLLYFIEIYISKKYQYYIYSDQSLLLVPIAISIVMLCLKSDVVIENAAIYRKASTIIYCAHPNVILVCWLLGEFGVPSLVAALIGLIILLIIVNIVLRLQKNNNIKWAKYLS